ncbi:MAG: universal stress protein, partial [Pseudomonadota bacterium]
MPLKTILIHVADDEHHVARRTLGVKLARAHNAHMRALFLTRPVSMPAGVTGRGASKLYLEEATARATTKAAELQAWFDERCDAASVSHDWIVEDGEHLDRLARHAHVADVVLVSQTAPHALEDRVSLSLSESITLAAGCPTICLPEG